MNLKYLAQFGQGWVKYKLFLFLTSLLIQVDITCALSLGWEGQTLESDKLGLTLSPAIS